MMQIFFGVLAAVFALGTIGGRKDSQLKLLAFCFFVSVLAMIAFEIL